MLFRIKFFIIIFELRIGIKPFKWRILSLPSLHSKVISSIFSGIFMSWLHFFFHFYKNSLHFYFLFFLLFYFSLIHEEIEVVNLKWKCVKRSRDKQEIYKFLSFCTTIRNYCSPISKKTKNNKKNLSKVYFLLFSLNFLFVINRI